MTKARDLANLGNKTSLDEINDAYDAGALSNRNLIINGAMKVAQRGTSSTGLGSGAGYFTCDRWSITGTASAGRLTMTQESDGPSGFANSMKLACTTADTSVAAGEKLILRQILEGQDLQQFAKGTSDAKEFTVSFYVKGNASATYVFELFDSDNTRQISKTFSVTTDWTRIILTYPADIVGAFADDNGISLYAQIWLHAGSDFTSGTLNSSAWASQTVANRASSSGTSFFDSTNRTFQITGVQLEVGDTATPFEHKNVGQELFDCQRYCQLNTAEYLRTYSTTAGSRQILLKPPMRATPTTSLLSGGVNKILDIGNAYRNINSLGGFELLNNHGGTQVTNVSSTSDSKGHIVTGECIIYDAEL